MAKCELKIVFDRADRTYAGGEQVTGAVEVHTDADVTCEALTLTRGWRTHGRGSEDSGGAATAALFAGRWAAGQSAAYPFAFDLPNGPFTHHGRYASIG